MKKKEPRKKSIKIIIIIIIILAILTISLLAIQEGFVEEIKRTFSEPTLFEIKDECAPILGSIIHQIKNEDGCKITCRNRCNLEEMNFDKVIFIEKENSCHTCNCYCK